MVTVTDTHVYMEVLEETKDENRQYHQVWNCRLASLPMGETLVWLIGVWQIAQF